MKSFSLFYKEVQGNEGDKCKYSTRLDTYGCDCQHDCKYCYAKSLLEDEVDEKYYISNKMKVTLLADSGNWKIGEKCYEINRQITRTINTREGCYRPDMSEYICDELPNNYNLLKVKSATKICEPVLLKNKGQEIVKQTNIATTLLARDYKGLGNQVGNGVINNSFIAIKNANSKGYIDLTYPNSTTRRGRVGHQVSQTIPASDTKGVVVPQYNNLRIRKLTPKECWRLMGFSDEDFEKAQKENSDTQLYKQAGNSIVVNVLEKILKELLKESK